MKIGKWLCVLFSMHKWTSVFADCDYDYSPPPIWRAEKCSRCGAQTEYRLVPKGLFFKD